MFAEVVTALQESPNSERDAGLRDLIIAQRRHDALIAVNVTVGYQRMIHLDDGHLSMRGYLRATGNWSNAEINRICRAAKLIDAFPTVGEAWLSGLIGTNQVTELAAAYAHPRAGDHLGEFIDILVDHAEHLAFDDFRRCVKHFITLADVEGSHRDVDRVNDDRNAHVGADSDGGVIISVTGGTGVTTEAFKRIHERFVEKEFANDVEARRAMYGDQAIQHPLPRTAAQRSHDAIHSIFLAASAVPADRRRPEPVVNIVGDVRTFVEVLRRHGLLLGGDPDGVGATLAGVADDSEGSEVLLDGADDLAGRRCETASGLPVHPDQLLQAALTGHIRRVLVDAAGVVVDMGRLQRLFTGSARTAAQLLVQRCTHLGCEIPGTLCDVDHMEPWVAAKGRTDQHNATVLCNPHDRLKHRRRLRTRRSTSGRVYTFREDGTIMLPAGERTPEFYDPDDDPTELARMTRLIEARVDALVDRAS